MTLISVRWRDTIEPPTIDIGATARIAALLVAMPASWVGSQLVWKHDMDGDPAFVDPASRDSPAAVDQRLARLLRDALHKLEPDEQAAVLRRYGNRHTLAEIADELGTTETAANTLIRRALRELRQSLIGVPTT